MSDYDRTDAKLHDLRAAKTMLGALLHAHAIRTVQLPVGDWGASTRVLLGPQDWDVEAA
jgi:hypothetical protein